MLHSKRQGILNWLSMRSRLKDRVVYNAMNNHQCQPTVALGTDGDRRLIPIVTVTSRSGKVYRVGIRLHPVTGEPNAFLRLPDVEDETHNTETIAIY